MLALCACSTWRAPQPTLPDPAPRLVNCSAEATADCADLAPLASGDLGELTIATAQGAAIYADCRSRKAKLVACIAEFNDRQLQDARR